MLKKIIVSGLFLALVAVLIAGAINRTIDKSERTADGSAEGTSRGRSAGRGIELSLTGAVAGRSQGQEYASNGGRQAQVSPERGYANYQEAPAEWVRLAGTVSQVPAAGLDLIIATTEGEIVIGTGPLDLSEQGFILQSGDKLLVQGYWEGEEFTAGELTLVERDMAITLRDEMGRPSWSGSRSTGRGRNGDSTGDDRATTDQADVGQWITLSGKVISVDDSALVVVLGNGQIINVENRPWWFAREQGFAAATGDKISLTGFYEGDSFEVGQINNLSNEAMVQIREESGRPLWAGGGRRAAQSLG